MEVADFPILTRIPELCFEPLQLSRVERVRIENEETDVSTREGVVALPVHVQGGIVHRVRFVVVADGRLELHPRVQQRLVRSLELVHEIRRSLRPVEVIAEHQDEIERKLLSGPHHPIGDFVLGRTARSVVTDDRELDRSRPVRQRRKRDRHRNPRDHETRHQRRSQSSHVHRHDSANEGPTK